MMLTSDTSQFLIDNQPLTPTTVTGHLQTIKDIKYSDQAADYSDALAGMKSHLGGDQNYGRVAYLYSDLRKRDWLIGNADQDAEIDIDSAAPNKIVQSFSESLLGTYVIDTCLLYTSPSPRD